jgi:hypothetical protein
VLVNGKRFEFGFDNSIGGREPALVGVTFLSRNHAVEPGCFHGDRELKPTFRGTRSRRAATLARARIACGHSLLRAGIGGDCFSTAWLRLRGFDGWNGHVRFRSDTCDESELPAFGLVAMYFEYLNGQG